MTDTTPMPEWVCSKCDRAFTPSAWMIKASYRQCPECKRTYEREYRAQRKARGCPIPNYSEPSERRNARHAMKMADPTYREKRNAKARERYHRDQGVRDKVSARRKVRAALERGELERSVCEICGTVEAEAHHDDYAKPLEVRWLCKSHHMEAHYA